MSRPYLKSGMSSIVIGIIIVIFTLMFHLDNLIANILTWASAVVFFLMGLWGCFKKEYGCKDVIQDIDSYFSVHWQDENEKTKEAFQRAIEHMTKGTTLEEHNVSCAKCWKHYQEMKRKYCGG